MFSEMDIIDYDRLNELVGLVGKEHLVLDLSCRKKISGGRRKRLII